MERLLPRSNSRNSFNYNQSQKGGEKKRNFYSTPTLESLVDQIFIQEHEDDVAQVVVLHEPSLPNWMGSIHPNGSLYELPVDVIAAREEHRQFSEELKKHGCTVLTVKEILLMDCSTNIVARVALEDLAFSCITYKHSKDDEELLTETDRFYLSDEYKRQCIDKMNNEQLVEVVLTNPTITLKKADKDTELLATDFSFQPLVNLVYCRDQQITTRKGVVMAALSSPVRAPEVKVMKFCFEKLGVKIIGEIPYPGKLEGGDFYPAGKDLCFIGVGLRSNMFAIHHMLEYDLFGTKRVAVVKDYFDCSQQRMHLDTVCNFLGRNLVLLLETLMGQTSPIRRLVDEYEQGSDGKYFMSKHDVEFSAYLQSEGFSIIRVTNQHQLNYGCNCLNLGNGNILSVDPATSKHLARNPLFQGRIVNLDFKNMTSMYGSLHCCSQVISRVASTSISPSEANDIFHFVNIGSVDRLDQLVSNGVDISCLADAEGNTLLHRAVIKGHINVVTLLLEYLVDVNSVNNKRQTPLDCAIEQKNTQIIELLKEHNAKLGTEILQIQFTSQKRLFQPTTELSNSSNVIFMVAPNNFSVNIESQVINPWVDEAREIETALSVKRGIRAVRRVLRQEYVELHTKISSLGTDIFLSLYETFQNAPESTFCSSIFSTHSAAETGDESTFVLYPVSSVRRNERTGQLISFLQFHYKKCINLVPCERGNLQYSEKPDTIDPYQLTKHSPANSENEKLLEFNSLVLDRINKVAYVSISPRANEEVAKLWAKVMKYELITFKTRVNNTAIHTSNVLTIGTGYAIFCPHVILEQTSTTAITNKLQSCKLEIIEITIEQLRAFCANTREVKDGNGKIYILASTTAYKAFTKVQIETLEKYAPIIAVPLENFEKLGGASVGSLFNNLF